MSDTEETVEVEVVVEEDPAPQPKPEKHTAKVVMLPSSALKNIRKESAEKATKQFQSQISAAGFSSLDELIAAAKKPAPASAEPAPKAEVAKADVTAPQETQKPVDSKAVDDSRRLAREKAALEKQLLAQKEQELAIKAQHELQLAALKSGVVELDYAMLDLQKHVATLDEKQLAAFKPEEFFTGLKKSKPFFFGAAAIKPDVEEPAPPPDKQPVVKVIAERPDDNQFAAWKRKYGVQ